MRGAFAQYGVAWVKRNWWRWSHCRLIRILKIVSNESERTLLWDIARKYLIYIFPSMVSFFRTTGKKLSHSLALGWILWAELFHERERVKAQESFGMACAWVRWKVEEVLKKLEKGTWFDEKVSINCRPRRRRRLRMCKRAKAVPTP